MKSGVNINLTFHDLQNARHNPLSALPSTPSVDGLIVYVTTGADQGFHASVNGRWIKLASTEDITTVINARLQQAIALADGSTATTQSASDDSTKVATTAFVHDAIEAELAVADAMIYKGTLGTGGTETSLPNNTAKVGWTYKVITAGTYAGQVCEVGDMVVALTDGSSSTPATWTVIQANIDGAVTGPTSATTDRIAVFDGTTGKVIKDGGKTIAELTAQANIVTDLHANEGMGTANKATTNPYIVPSDNTTQGAKIQLKGSGATSVASDANGAITITSTDSSTTEAGHYTPSTAVSSKTKGSTAARTYVKQVKLDSKNHVIDVVTGTETYTANDGTLTIQANGTNIGTFTADQSTNSTVNITNASLGIVANKIPLTGTSGTITYDSSASTPTANTHVCGTSIVSAQIRANGEVVMADITIDADGTVRWSCSGCGTGTDNAFVAADSAYLYIMACPMLTV